MNILKIFRKPEIMYVIIGTQIIEDLNKQLVNASHEEAKILKDIISKEKPYVPPSYDTDPRKYGLPVFSETITDDDFEKNYRHKIHAFQNKQDAISFAYSCNLVSMQCHVYIKKGSKWIFSKDRTSQMTDEIN